MAEYLIQKETLDQLAVAVREKAGIDKSMTPEEIIREVYLLETDTDTGAPSTGVIFYDYDGTVLHTYTVKEARALTALPDGPVHEGLPFAGWTHTLEEVNATMKILHVGAMYSPENTKFVIDTNNAGTTVVKIIFTQTVSGGVRIYWGDGSSNTVSGTSTSGVIATHTYSSHGEYTIEFVVNSGTFTIGGHGTDYLFTGVSDTDRTKKSSILKSAIIGTKNTKIGDTAFGNCINISNIVIPYGTTSIPEQFLDNGGMTTVIVPNTVTKICRAAFRECESLKTIVIPESVCKIEPDTMQMCDNICDIILPSKINNYTSSLFSSNDNIKNIYCKSVRPSFPNTNYSNVFYNINKSCIIYVPAQSVDYYKNSSDCASVVNQIKPMPVQYV